MDDTMSGSPWPQPRSSGQRTCSTRASRGHCAPLRSRSPSTGTCEAQMAFPEAQHAVQEELTAQGTDEALADRVRGR